MPYKIREDYLG